VTTTTWPPLPLQEWKDTYETLHMWTQIVGKISLAQTPKMNHFWNTAFHLTARGLTTQPLRSGDSTFVIQFDFTAHRLIIQGADGGSQSIPLEPRTVADFYRLVMDTLDRMHIPVRIWTVPSEVPNPIRFEQDVTHRAYDPAAANRFWRVLLAIAPVFTDFRCRFVGKNSPVHFFWGSFDLATTRFSGLRAPERPGADSIMREAYSHEVISHGWWPGSGSVKDAAFYAYAAPEPAGFKTAAIAPAGVYYDTEFSIFILPYEAVRATPSPEATLTTFLRSSYETAADLANWRRTELERRES
jgi:uncharacterized protein DUF5996